MWQKDKSPDSPGRLENLKELISAIEDFDTLGGFLEHISLVMDNETTPQEGEVTLMTLHAAKGLEFDMVFLPGWEDGIFPSQRTLDESGGAGLEEERRLAYVGLTWARRQVCISFAANRRVHGLWQSSIPSRFVGELPARHIDEDMAQGLSFGQVEPVWSAPLPNGLDNLAMGRAGNGWRHDRTTCPLRLSVTEMAGCLSQANTTLNLASGCFTRNSVWAQLRRWRLTSWRYSLIKLV